MMHCQNAILVVDFFDSNYNLLKIMYHHKNINFFKFKTDFKKFLKIDDLYIILSLEFSFSKS